MIIAGYALMAGGAIAQHDHKGMWWPICAGLACIMVGMWARRQVYKGRGVIAANKKQSV